MYMGLWDWGSGFRRFGFAFQGLGFGYFGLGISCGLGLRVADVGLEHISCGLNSLKEGGLYRRFYKGVVMILRGY